MAQLAPATAPNGHDDPFEAAVSIEDSFFQTGYANGFTHGEQHGRVEGGELGRKTGFEIWEELGYYEGQARFWLSVLAKNDDAKAKRSTQMATQLLDLISQYPMTNAATANTNMEALLSSARSKYRVLCAGVGVRPRVQVATMSV